MLSCATVWLAHGEKAGALESVARKERVQTKKTRRPGLTHLRSVLRICGPLLPALESVVHLPAFRGQALAASVP